MGPENPHSIVPSDYVLRSGMLYTIIHDSQLILFGANQPSKAHLPSPLSQKIVSSAIWPSAPIYSITPKYSRISPDSISAVQTSIILLPGEPNSGVLKDVCECVEWLKSYLAKRLDFLNGRCERRCDRSTERIFIETLL